MRGSSGIVTTLGGLALVTALLAGCSSTSPSTAEGSAAATDSTTTFAQLSDRISTIGTIDADGVKLRAVVVEYDTELAAGTVSADDFAVSDYCTMIPQAFELGAENNPGSVTKAYVNSEPQVLEGAENGGGQDGSYAVIEVETDYQMASVAFSYRYALAAGVTQTRDIEAADGTSLPAWDAEEGNYLPEDMQNPMTGETSTFCAAEAGTYAIDDIAGYEIRSEENGEAFQASDCFEEATGETIDVTLPYALYVPEDYDASKEYALVLHIHDAGFVGTDPMITLTESASPATFASARMQQLLKDQGLGGAIVVCPQISADLQSTRDNWSVSAAVGATWQLMDSLTATYSIDEDRIYGSGQSMGGMQVAAMAAQRDNYFAGLYLPGCQWGSCYNLEEPFGSFGSEPAPYYPSQDTTIWREDADGTSTVETNSLGEEVVARNWYYLLSDDNILAVACDDDLFATSAWNEFKFLYEDMGFGTIPEASYNPLEDSVEAMNQVVDDLLAEGSSINIVHQSGGSHMLTWVYTSKVDAYYEWLLTQTRKSEMDRDKVAQMANAWEAETDEALVAASQTPEREINGSGFYFAIPAEDAGTAGYNSCWYANHGELPMEGREPGWTVAAE